MDTWRLCCTEIRHDAELHTAVSKVPYRAQTPIKSSKSLFTTDILDNAQDTDAWAESFDKTIGYENSAVTQIVEAIEDLCQSWSRAPIVTIMGGAGSEAHKESTDIIR